MLPVKNSVTTVTQSIGNELTLIENAFQDNKPYHTSPSDQIGKYFVLF